MTGFVALAIGLFLVPEFRLAGGDVDPEPLEPLATTGRVGVTVLMGKGATAVVGLTSSGDVDA